MSRSPGAGISAEGCSAAWDDFQTPLPALPPRCSCGGLARPGVVWFGEGLPAGVWEAAVEAVSAADLVLVIGTSAVVYPAAQLVPLAARAGARVIEINIEETPASTHAGICLRGPSGQILPQLIAEA